MIFILGTFEVSGARNPVLKVIFLFIVMFVSGC